MLSVDEAFEALSQALTPSAEHMASVSELHERLREAIKADADLVASVDLLGVIVIDGTPRPLFAITRRRTNVPLEHSRWFDVKRRFLQGTEPGARLDGAGLVFDLVERVVASTGRGTVGAAQEPRGPDGDLPELTDGVEDGGARLARLVLLAHGPPSTAIELAGMAAAVRTVATKGTEPLGERLRDALVSLATSQSSNLVRFKAIRADHALTLEHEGDLAGAHIQWRVLLGRHWPVAAPQSKSRRDVVSGIGVRGVRSIDALRLDARGMKVLIGENGAGKSTLVEACELLRRAASPAFLDEFNAIHGGLRLLLRHGADELALTVDVRGRGRPLTYELRVAPKGSGAVVAHERLVVGRPDDASLSVVVLSRDRASAHILRQDHTALARLSDVPDGPVLSSFGSRPPHPEIARMVEALKGIEVHVPFEVTPGWVSRAHGRQAVMRGASLIQSASSVERLGVNLANAWHALRSDVGEDHWRETMDYVRLGLGDRIESINTRADAAGGSIALWVKLKNRDEQIPAASLSEGMLAYLAFVAMFRLPSKRSLLVFDEPELHLHPRLLTRVMGFFDAISEESPVLLATHSRRILDTLRDPAASTVLCVLDDDGRTVLRHPDRVALDAWLEDYDGLGRILDAGYESEVMVVREET